MAHIYESKRKVAAICFCAFLLVAGVLALTIGIMTSEIEIYVDKEPQSHLKAIDSFCQPVPYKNECIKTLTQNHSNDVDPRQLASDAFKLTRAVVTKSLLRFEDLRSENDNDHRTMRAFEVCHEVARYSIRDLDKVARSYKKVFNDGNFDAFIGDLRVWIGGAMTYQDVCLDAFENTTGDARKKMEENLLPSRKMIVNALAILTNINDAWKTALDMMGGMKSTNHKSVMQRRGLLAEPAAGSTPVGGTTPVTRNTPVAGKMPSWVDDKKRNIMGMPLAEIKADLEVAKDGSIKTIREALHLVPKNNDRTFVIKIKEGIYQEHVTVKARHKSIVFVGDGPMKTVISLRRSFADGWPTFKTATIDVDGDGFMARDIGFENVADPLNGPSVAARVSSDYSIFYNCHFTGHQGTLYTVRSRQFYRDCVVSGTVDFIFGDAVAVFQNSHAIFRHAISGQDRIAFSQSRADKNGPGAMIIQNCTITSEPVLDPTKPKPRSYLGRPLKSHSRTIIMHSSIGDFIAPEGWTLKKSDLGSKTSFYAEYQNRGPGSGPAHRVDWPAIKKLSSKEVIRFSPEMIFVNGNDWIASTGCPYYGNILPKPN